ncbi:MAG: DUF5518 domain-containing protein [Haloarculaceae archaeon]
MGWSRTRKDLRLFFVGQNPRPVAVGAAVVVLYTLGMFLLAQLSIDLGNARYIGGLIGGLVAGLSGGRGWMHGATVGGRAGSVGMLSFSVLLTLLALAFWSAVTGSIYVISTGYIGLLGVLFFVPAFGLLGMIGGVVGAIVRQHVIGDKTRLRPSASE